MAKKVTKSEQPAKSVRPPTTQNTDVLELVVPAATVRKRVTELVNDALTHFTAGGKRITSDDWNAGLAALHAAKELLEEK